MRPVGDETARLVTADLEPGSCLAVTASVSSFHAPARRDTRLAPVFLHPGDWCEHVARPVFRGGRDARARARKPTKTHKHTHLHTTTISP